MAEARFSIGMVLEPALQPVLRPSPALVAAASLLVLPSLELEQAVERELSENPALERADTAACRLCGRPLGGSGRCVSCDRPRPVAAASGGGVESLAERPAPAETLLREVGPVLRAGDRAVAVYLLGSLDERGFLDTTVDETARALDVEASRVARVLRAIQDVAPAGVGARDLRECLLLQLDRCRDDGPAHALARRIVDRHLPLLGKAMYGELSRALDVERDDVIAARDFIRTRLQPYPGLAIASAAPAPPLLPDLVVRETDDGLAVDLVERDRFQLVVSPSYERAAGAAMSPEEREAIRRQLLAARAFIDRLEQRWSTTRAVAELAVERQQEFVRRGARRLVPLTRAEVAAALGVHESTVSRAVAGRNMLLPSGRIVPLARFFDRSGAPRDALAQLLAAEDRPRSDAELVDDLANLGFTLARRTVAKYRARLGVLPSVLR